MAPKLSSDHVKLPVGRHIKVNIAAQMLSQTCAVVIGTYLYICLGQMNDRAIDTADFMEDFKTLFDVGNGTSPNASAHKPAVID